MRWICFLIFISSTLAGKPLDVDVSARSAILMNADSGAILFEKHAHVPSFPASTTKIATALFILDHKMPSLDTMVTVSAECLKLKDLKNPLSCPSHWQEIDGTKMGLVRGEILSLESLLHGLMLVSGNDAANVLGESLSGSVPNFIDEMNQYVRSLGCQNTCFKNPHGLHHPEHRTTAYDICLITKKALKIPKFREIVSKISYMKPKSNKQPLTEIKQHNPLVKEGKHYYPKAIGVKTGFHSAAGNCLVAAAEHEGRTLIAVAFGCEKRHARYEDAVRLFETAFAEKKERKRFLGPEQIFSHDVAGSKIPLRAALAQEIAIEYYPAEEPSCKAFVHWEMTKLPIRKGQKVGEIRLVDQEGNLLQKQDLAALQEVKGTFFFVLKEKFNEIFR